jgi:hypothetical protein
MNSNALNKKVYIICGGLLVILFVFVVVITIQKLNYKKALLNEGVRTQAQVINKYHLKTNKGKIKKSYLELAVFEDTTAVAIQKNRKAEDEPKNINDKIDNLFDDFGTSKTPTSQYKSVTTLVSLERYGMTKIGESKTYVYLKGEIEDGMLLDVLE